MSSPTPTGHQSPAQSPSKNIEIDIYVFHCGQGDTILVRLPDDRWVLVDCFLPKEGGIRDRFFAFLDAKRIDHLAMIVQTHPDRDHFHGMHAVLDYFTTQNRKVDCYFDSGVRPNIFNALLNKDYSSEYFSLLEKVNELARRKKIKERYELDSRRGPLLSPNDFGGRIDLIPIGPDATKRKNFLDHCFVRLAKKLDTRFEANGLSIILGMVLQDQGRDCYILFTADAKIDGIEDALGVWATMAKDKGWPNVFDVIKVAHHGSIKNHCRKLCKVKRHGSEPRFAVISAGAGPVLPDKR